LPGKSSPKVAEAARMLRHTHKFDKPIHLHGLDGDISVVGELSELLAQWDDVFNFFPFHALLTPNGVVSFQDKPVADATIINHGIDDAALFELSGGTNKNYEIDRFTHAHADYMMKLIGDASQVKIQDAQERAANSIISGVKELTRNGGMVFLTHYNTINWTKYESFEPGYFSLVSGFAQGAFGLVKEMAKISKTLDVQPVTVKDFVLFDNREISLDREENMFNDSNLLVLRKD
jgi:hypothetical protein